MKKLLCVLISVMMLTGIFTSLPAASSAATKNKAAVSLKKKSAKLKITEKDGKAKFGSTTIKIKAAKCVKIKKTTFKSLDTKIAKVNKSGKVTAKSRGTAKIAVKVKYTQSKKTKTQTLTFKAKVYDKRGEAEFLKKLSKFSNKLYAMSAANEEGNYVMSPASIYMALAMIYYIGDKDVRAEVKEFVNMKASDLARTGELFESLTKKYTYNDWESQEEKVIGQVNLSNSIWLNEGEKVNQNMVKELAEKLFCEAKSAPFKSNNKEANKQLREFIKEKTNGLIDQDFGLSTDTLAALVNTLYFKDLWEYGGRLNEVKKNFTAADGTKSKIKFLEGNYLPGQVRETETSQYFYAQTGNKYKVKFILPKDGYTLKDAMSADNLEAVNAQTAFEPIDTKGAKHFTRCIFPKFKIESDTPLKQIISDNKYLSKTFSAFNSKLTDKELFISDIKHKAVLDVNREGIEGAAVTIAVACATSMPPQEVKIYHDFVLNSSFGFIITDPDDVVLFEGQVTNP